MVQVRFDGKDVEIPQNVTECSIEQYRRLVFLAYILTCGVITLEQFREKWMCHLLGLSDLNIYRKDIQNEVVALMENIESFLIYSEKGGVKRVTVDLKTGMQMLPDLGDWKARVGDMLEGMKFGEFVECLEILNMEESGDGDNWQAPYERIARLMYSSEKPDAKVPGVLTFHSVTFFSTIWETITTMPVNISGSDIDFRIIFQGVSSGPDDKTGWRGVTFEVASANVFGNVAAVNDTPFWDVLLYLYKCKFEYNHQKKGKKK